MGTRARWILCDGLGVSSGILTVDTIDTNVVEYLAVTNTTFGCDYRSSIELASAHSPANADMIAAIDYPEAVAKSQPNGGSSVQLVVHCFGSTV